MRRPLSSNYMSAKALVERLLDGFQQHEVEAYTSHSVIRLVTIPLPVYYILGFMDTKASMKMKVDFSKLVS